MTQPTMKYMDRRSSAKLVAKRWELQYRDYIADPEKAKNFVGGSPVDIYNKLLAMGENPNPDEIDKMLGNTSWTTLMCPVCMTEKEHYVLFGDEDEDNEGDIPMCCDCIEAAYGLIAANKPLKSTKLYTVVGDESKPMNITECVQCHNHVRWWGGLQDLPRMCPGCKSGLLESRTVWDFQ